MSIGSELKNAREARKISLEDVAKKTKIPVKYLEAIESDNYSIFPSQVYVKGFIRAMAKVAGLDPMLLTRQFKSEVKAEEVKIEPGNPEAEMERTLGWRPTLDRPPVFNRPETNDLNLEMVDADQFEGPPQHDPSIRKQRSRMMRKWKWTNGMTQAVIVLVILGACVFGWEETKGWFGKIKLFTPKPVAPTAANAYDAINVTDKYQHLILKGLDKSWVLVTMDDGQSSSEVDLAQGEVKTYQALRNFKLRLGNAGGVDVQFNGKPMGILGTTGQVVEITLPPGPDSDTVDQDSDNS